MKKLFALGNRYVEERGYHWSNWCFCSDIHSIDEKII